MSVVQSVGIARVCRKVCICVPIPVSVGICNAFFAYRCVSLCIQVKYYCVLVYTCKAECSAVTFCVQLWICSYTGVWECLFTKEKEVLVG